ncbi:MAG TPA: protein meaA, partial [Aestuariivirgaceae bacterium]|nr:protein meaA [Aestuariivirgaceae bacterium]
YVFPPRPSLRLTSDMIVWCGREMPRWNPINVCSYHLQEAGATPVQEVAYALATAITVLDAVRQAGRLSESDFAEAVGRISFFVNAGIKLVTEIAKLRAFAELWDGIAHDRYGVADARLRRFRYGVQVNSLGLTEQQPENNVHRIMLEMLAVVLSKRARARAVQLPAWNEALGLPRPWDQQWSLRMQQIVAYETDLLEHEDIFDGSIVMAEKVDRLKTAIGEELDRIAAMGGAIAAVESGYMKGELVKSNTARLRAIESGEETVVGVNAFTPTEPSPLSAGAEQAMATVSEHIELDLVAKLKRWRAGRDHGAVARALTELEAAARDDRNIMEPSIACAKAGVTTGEWGDTLRRVFGEYRAPTGIAMVSAMANDALDDVRRAVAALSAKFGQPLKLLVGKPGLDGHSNGAEQIAVRARECGIDVIYDGIRFTPAELVEAAVAGAVHIVGLSILSGSHVSLVRDVMNGLKARGLGSVPVIVGGIIPEDDGHVLKQLGVARIYTPKDYRLTVIMADIVKLVDERTSARDGSNAA